jgi:hypothetical protein
MVSARAVSAAAAGVVVVAFLGGALSGKLENARSAAALPPSTTTTTAAPFHLAPVFSVAVVEQDMVEDLGLDASARRLDPDVRQRAALAGLPVVARERHADIALAWAPAVVAAADAAADTAVVAAAANASVPSYTAATFEVTRWGRVTITGGTATATCVGHLELVEPAIAAGVVDQPDQTWTVALTLGPSGRWLMETRAAS